MGDKFEVSTFMDQVRASKATVFSYVGETPRYLLSAPESPYDREHRVKVAYGNGMRPDVWRRFQQRFGIPIIGEFFHSSEGGLGLLNVCRGE